MPSRWSGRSCLLSVVALLAFGCASPATYRPLTSEHFPQRPADCPVVISDGSCEQPYTAIAEVTTQPYESRILDVAGRQELEKMARRLGGDAVIRVARNDVTREEFGYRPGALFRLGTRFVDRSTLTGVVVQYTCNP